MEDINKYVDVFVKFLKNKRKMLPKKGYRPHIIINDSNEYLGVTFIELELQEFDEFYASKIKFVFDDNLYDEIEEDQIFSVMEGSNKVAEGIFIQIHK